MNPTSSSPQAAWHINPHKVHHDPLLDCLFEIIRSHGGNTSRESLAAGLPLVDHSLTPELLPRAAARAGFAARVVRRDLLNLPKELLPAILLLNGQRACVLLEKLPDGQAHIRWPEAGESAERVDLTELAGEYSGVAIIVRPRFHFEARAPELGKLRDQHWFWGVVKQNRLLYRDAMLAALILNLLALAIPFFSMNVYDRVVPNRATSTLWFLALGIGFVLSFDLILKVVRSYILDIASKRIDVKVSALLMERILGLRMEARPDSVGSFAANIRAFEFVKEFIGSATITALVDVPFALVFLIALMWISPWFIVPPLVGIVLVLLYAWFTQEEMQQLMALTQRATAQRNAALVENLVGIETVKTQVAESGLQRKWERATIFLSQVSGKLKLLSSSAQNFSMTVQQAVNIVTVVLGVYLLIAGEISMGGIIAATMLCGRALSPLAACAGILLQYQNAHQALQGLESYMRLPVERPSQDTFLHRGHFRGDIEFRDVQFHYPNSDENALDGVSFRLRAGEKVAIIGRTGSGKTTLEKLVLGLYQPTAGSLTIDGVDSRQIDPAELRRAVGFVAQDSMLFYGTLRENIALGAPFASDSMVLAAAEAAGVTEFANRHPRGFEMMISERGESLSGGQRQAVCIARALLNEPPIMVLDEPTSSLDSMSEEKLKQKLSAAMANKTVLLVSHRNSLLDLVDRLIVIDRGRILADGPKEQVIKALQSGQLNSGAAQGGSTQSGGAAQNGGANHG